MISRRLPVAALVLGAALLVTPPGVAQERTGRTDAPQGWFTDVAAEAGLAGQRAKD